MRVAIWADNVLDPRRSGMGHHQAYLLRALDALPDPHRYTVLFTARCLGQQFPLELSRVRPLRLPGVRHAYYPLWHLLEWPPLDLFLPEADVVHLLHASVTVPTRQPAIVTIVDLASRRFPAAYPWRRRVFKDVAVRRAARRTSVHFMANTEFVKAELCDLYDVAPERVTVVHLGVDHQRFRPVEEEATLERVRQRYALRRPFFLFVGMFSPRKNLEPLIRGVAEFNRRSGAGYDLVLVGASGWQDQRVFRAAEEAGCVRLTGYVPDADLPALYTLATALVFPSSSEGFGLPLLEAMACGTPVVANRATSIPEVVGDAALLLDEVTPAAIAAALDRLMGDQALRHALVARGLARAQSFTWERAARRCVDLYERMGHLCG